VERFHAQKAVTGMVMSCYIIAALAIRPLSGYMLDKYSRKQIYLWSFLFFVLFYFGYIIAGSLLLIIIMRIMHGFTWGTITTASNTLAIDIMPPSKRGEGLGYYGMAINLSMAIGPVAGLFLYDHYNFDVIFFTAITTGFAGLIAAALIKAPEKIHVVHDQRLSLDRFLLLQGIPIGINLIFIAVSYGMILSFAAMYGKEIRVEHTGMFFTMMAIGIAVSRIFSGKLVDRGKIHFAALMGLLMLASSLVLFSFSANALSYFLSALFIGLGYGILFPAFQTLFINMAHHNQRGTANSTYYTAFDVGVGAGMIIAGKIAETSGLAVAFGFSAFLSIAAILFYWKISMASYQANKVV
jgi:predicted MFS family arabinose efflux permease